MRKNSNFRSRLIAFLTVALVLATVSGVGGLLLSLQDRSDWAFVLSLLGLGTTAICLVAGLTMTRELFSRLDRVTAAADELASKRLPKLISAALTDQDASFPAFEAGDADEVGAVIGDLNTIQSSTIEQLAEQRDEVRKGLSNLVVNLVRRNQSLLERQIEHIDVLEAGEEDPDRLEQLYGVDHLATRMRRNAESLLVLAGSEPLRRKGDPISINDLLRVAMGEIEGYRSVHLAKVDEGRVTAQNAFDIAHLASELLENATQFSPPNAQVDVGGSAQSDGSYLISIADHGIGMSPEQIEQTNQLLADPPELHLGLGRSLGFIVVARLAQRMKMTVELAATPGGAGVTALVLIPTALLTRAGADDGSSLAMGRTSTPSVAATGISPTPLTEGGGTPNPAIEAAVPAMPSLEEGPGWSPPAMPERSASELGKRQATDEPASPVQSEALARLLGHSPTLPDTPAPSHRTGSPTPAAPTTGAPGAGAPTAPGTPASGQPDQTTPGSPAPGQPAQPGPAGTPAPGETAPGQPGIPAPGQTAHGTPAPGQPGQTTPSTPGTPGALAAGGAAGGTTAADQPGARTGVTGETSGAHAVAESPAAPAAGQTPGAPAADQVGAARPGAEAPIDQTAMPTWDIPARGSGGLLGRSAEAPAPGGLEEALPTGEDFESGVASLLEETAAAPASGSRTSAGLVMRDRSRSRAPASEGRVIGDSGRAATVSPRDPQEIRDMLARYRKARGGNNPVPSTEEPESRTESGGRT